MVRLILPAAWDFLIFAGAYSLTILGRLAQTGLALPHHFGGFISALPSVAHVRVPFGLATAKHTLEGSFLLQLVLDTPTDQGGATPGLA